MAVDQNSKTLELNSQKIPYRYRFSKKAKYLQLRINRQHLELIIPHRISLAEGEHFLHKKSDWIIRHAHLFHKAEHFFLFGKKMTVVIQSDLFLMKYRVEIKNEKLTFHVPEMNTLTVPELFDKYLKHVALKYLVERTRQLSTQFSFNVSKISVRGQSTRWGSCSRRANISLNYLLLKFRREVIDYVIIHELCHLRQMNHSRRFWDEVAVILPDYKKLKNELKNQTV